MKCSLIENFSSVPDHRIDRTKLYPLNEIIFLVICATISSCDGWSEIKDFGEAKLLWLRKFLPFKNGIPVDDTIARVMRKLDTKAFQGCFVNWMQSVSKATEGDVIAIDGKTLRRSHDRTNDVSAIHMVSAWSSENGVVLGQEKTAEKSNEITEIPKLLETLELKGCIVTIDAMGCQTAIADKIIKSEADYILALKGNQTKLHAEIKKHFELTLLEHESNNEAIDFYEERNAGHGRIEHRQCWVLPANVQHCPSIKKWNSLKSLVMLRSYRTIKDHTSEEVRFFISSISPNAERSLKAVRKHWGIENALHWTLDLTFREDESRVRKGASPENLAIMRHIALNVIKRDTSIKAGIKRKRLNAALLDDYRAPLIRQAI
jgi:predicted transposase YbfD/YdcC